MEDLFGSHLAPMFIESGPLDDFWLQCIVRLWYELPCEGFDNRR
jgi:hypothetical protein